ncbi:integrase, catalytic region, zinc finger, CCHC-type containing protein [Tanacetum coccineum]
MINRIYYVEYLNHNLFSVGQFCDADLEVAFQKSTCFVTDLQGNDLLTGNRGSDIYTISLQETSSSTPICFMAKASPTQAWLWHQRLSHLNFDYINLSKAKRSSFKTKAVPSSKGRLNLLHIDLYGPMRVASVNGKKYILSKGYRVYNIRTRLIVESIHLRFDEIKEMPETSVDNNTSGLILQRQQASDYDDSGLGLNTKMFLFSRDNSFITLKILYNKTHLPTTNVRYSSEPTTLTKTVYAEENNDNQAVNTQVQQDEFINPFCTPVREVAESSSRNIDNSNMHTFYQPYNSEYRWTKDHLLEQVCGNSSKPVQTRQKLATNPKMCMFVLTVSTAEPKNIKEAMADSAWIEAMHEELHQFNKLQVWELIDKPFGKNVIKLKWL